MTHLIPEKARHISIAALALTVEHGRLVTVIDRHGSLVCFAQQNDSTLASVMPSQSKAWTTELQAATQPGQAVYGLAHAGGPSRPIMAVPRAVPIRLADGNLFVAEAAAQAHSVAHQQRRPPSSYSDGRVTLAEPANSPHLPGPAELNRSS